MKDLYSKQPVEKKKINLSETANDQSNSGGDCSSTKDLGNATTTSAMLGKKDNHMTSFESSTKINEKTVIQPSNFKPSCFVFNFFSIEECF